MVFMLNYFCTMGVVVESLAKKLNLGIDISNRYWIDAYNKAVLEPAVPYFISKEFLDKIQDEYGILTQNYDVLISAVDLIKQDENLCLLSKILYHLLFLEVDKNEIFEGFNFSKAQNKGKNTLGKDLFLVFPILAHIPYAYEILARRGIERGIIISSLSQLDICITEATEQEGRPFFSNSLFLSYKSFIYLRTLRIGRLRFEIAPKSYGNFMVLEDKNGNKKVLVNDLSLHKSGNALGNLGFADKKGSFVANILETDSYIEGYSVDEKSYLVNVSPTKFDKKEWQVIYGPTDDKIIVHIPPKDSLDRQSVLSSYERARKIFKNSFPEYDFKAFVTDSWLFAPALDMVLKENSNIRTFRKDYIIFPARCEGLDIFHYVFNLFPKTIEEVDIDNLPEDNSLRKGIKEQLKKGNYFYEFFGFYKF